MNEKSLKLSGPFHLESGDILPEVEVTYHLYGQINEDGSNVICVVHALTANSDVQEWWPGLCGPGNVYDFDRYAVLCLNNLGSPYGTTSPKSINPSTGRVYGLDFPFFTVRDIARLHIAAMNELGVESIYCLIGPSCGGNIAQEMAYVLEDKVENLALVCCSAQETPWVIAIHEAQRQALRADPDFQHGAGGMAGLNAARSMALLFYRSYESFLVRQSENTTEKIYDFRASSYIRYQGEKFINRFDPYCYYHLLNALDTHQIGRGRNSAQEALGRITAKTLCLGFSTDILISPAEQLRLAQAIPNAEYVEIATIFGHDAFLIETDKVKQALLNFMGRF